MQERPIPESAIKGAFDNPTKIGYDSKGRMLVKKLYRKNGNERLLLVVCEKIVDILEIITIIDTSKVKKYL